METQTHTDMAASVGRIMGRVFLTCCDWYLKGCKTNGGMGASAAQLTLSECCACACVSSYTREIPMWLSRGLWQEGMSVCLPVCVCRVSNALPLSVTVSSYSLVEGIAGTSGSMFMMRFLWLRELKLRLWPNWALKNTNVKMTTFCILTEYPLHKFITFLCTFWDP